MWDFPQWYTHGRVFLLEYIYIWLPGLWANIPKEKTPLPLTVGGPMDRLLQLS